jgi:RHS repeat-associated protein
LPTGVVASNYKFFGGDFDGNGSPDFLLQGFGSRYSYVLTADTTGTPQKYYNFGTSLNSASINAVDVDQNGRTDIVATDGSGNITTYLSNYAAGFDTNVPSYSTLVGSINGKFRVDEQGESTYSVDILSAAGTAGVAPHISLGYSSSGGNGIAGIGWSVGGVSAISRCRQTLMQDSNVTAVTLGATDRFCLDGQRLILTSGTYGASGSTYRTEIDSYAVITANGGTTGNPAYFTVVRKDGSTSTYGNGNGSQQLLGSAVLNWSISQFKDSVGNPIRFSYLNNPTGANPSTNEHLISRIDYGYGTDPGTTNNSSTYIQFTYQTRPDISSGYVFGSLIQSTQRLTTIRSYSSGTELRNYNLVYRAPDGVHTQSFVEKLMECVGTSCLSPTTFNWNLQQGGFNSSGSTLATINGTTPVSIRMLDINGDGRADLVYMQSVAPYNVYYQLWNSGTNSYAAPVQFASVADGNTNWQVLDYNNDGNQDLMVGTAGQNWKLYLGGPSGLTPSGTNGDTGIPYLKNTQLVDLNSDGLADLVYTPDSGFGLKYRLLQRSAAFGAEQSPTLNLGSSVPCVASQLGFLGTVKFLDYNGDGRIDIPAIVASVSGTPFSGGMTVCMASTILVMDSSGAYNATTWSVPTANSTYYTDFVDINGDGLQDQLGQDGGGTNLQFNLNTGNGFAAATTLGTLASMPSYQFADYNADGYADLMYGTGTSLFVRLYNPATQSFGNATAIPGIPYQAAGSTAGDQDIFVDVDGDGHTDLLRVQNTSTNNVITLYKSNDTGSVGNRIVGIDNGLGNATTITYKPLTDTNVYTKGTDANDVNKWPGAPVFDIVAPSYVVASVSSTAPVATGTPGAVNYGATSSVSYKYAGLKLQASGRGALGFASIVTTDTQTNVVTTTNYRQDFPFIGQPLNTRVQTSLNGPTIKYSTNAAASTTIPGLGGTNYYQIYVPTITEQNFDPTSFAETSYVVTSTNQPDSWGNVTGTTSSTYAANDHTNYLMRKSTVNDYGTSAYELQFGRLKTSTVTQQRAGMPDVVRTASFTYYGSGDGVLQGLLKTESVSVPDGSASASTTYKYDGFGNKTCVSRGTSTDTNTNCAIGTTNRYVKTTYDAYGRFVASSASPFNNGSWAEQTTETVVDRYPNGAPWHVQGLNGFTTTYTYDVLGRESSRSDSSGASLSTTYYRGGITGAQYQVVTHANSGATATQYFDALGRSIAKTQVGYNGRTVSSETEYDNIGRVKRQSAPHFSGDTVYWAINTYDNFRLQNQVVPASSGSTATSSFGYSGLNTTLTNALGQTRIEKRNAAGELVEVDDYLGGVVQYTYDAAGQLITTTTCLQACAVTSGNTIISTYLDYDQLGRKIKMRDSDKGTWFYSYNAFGDLTDQYKVMSTSNYGSMLAAALADTNVLMQHTHMNFDLRGRQISRYDYRETRPMDSVLEGSATWTYDTATYGLGQLAQESGGGLTRNLGYDSLGRLNSTLLNNGNGSYLQTVAFDSFGRAYQQTDALGTGSGTQSNYDNNGYLLSITEIASGTILYQVQNMDARGNVTQAATGNGATSNWNYDAGSGLLLTQTANIVTTTLQNLAYTWDLLGNQKSRQDQGLGKNLQQSFCYDGLNRLIKTNEASLNGSCSMTAAQQDQEYDGFGNITRKANVGNYTYNTAHPHQLQSTSDGVAYTYDNVGNMTSDLSNRILSYTVFDKPYAISKLNNQITFAYGADRNYYKRVDSDGTNTTTTYQIGGVEKVLKPDGTYDMKRYLPGGGLWTYHFNSGGTQTSVDKQYIYKDALGSVTVITDGVGTVKQQLAYNAWGQRVNNTDWKTVLPSTTFLPVSQQFTTRGYTGQDMLDAVGLIHYGGRIYDARIGRFVQADPVVQDGEDLQAYNRYAYVRNNPLTLTDPSGFSWLSKAWKHVKHALSPKTQTAELLRTQFKIEDYMSSTFGFIRSIDNYTASHSWVQMIGTAVATYFGGPAGAAAAAAHNAHIQGAGVDDAMKAGAIAGVSAMAFSSIGGYYGDTWTLGRVGWTAVAGGATAEASGGSFKDGFLMSGGMALLTYGNYAMRREMVAQSSLNSENINGKSAGFFGDGEKLAGARRVLGEICESLMGGCQGAPHPGESGSSFFGKTYNPGGAADYINESFAGPHDWLRNLTGSYDASGNGIHLDGGALMWDKFKNYSLVVPAAPLAIAGMISTTPGMSYVVATEAQ